MARTAKAKVEVQNEEVQAPATIEAPTAPKVRKAEIQPTAEQVKEMEGMTTSNKIRYLANAGYSTKENLYSGIANYLEIRTQHVRNVLNQVLKGRATAPTTTTANEPKA